MEGRKLNEGAVEDPGVLIILHVAAEYIIAGKEKKGVSQRGVLEESVDSYKWYRYRPLILII